MFAHVEAPPPRLADVPAALADAVERAMAKRPDQRFPSASEFARALVHSAAERSEASATQIAVKQAPRTRRAGAGLNPRLQALTEQAPTPPIPTLPSVPISPSRADVAAAAVSILCPCLRMLLAGDGTRTEKIERDIGAHLLAAGRRLWGQLSPHLEGRPAALEAAEEVARRPDDARACGALELQLERLLDARPALAAEIAAVVTGADAAATKVVGARGVAVGGSAIGSVIVTGDEVSIQ